jgi:threonine aldolase
MWGGGMRQVGILAAAALYGLDHNFPRLEEDHRKAKALARAVERCAGLRLARPVMTNILIVEVVEPDDTPAALVEALGALNVRAAVWSERTVRFVTHLDVSLEDADRVAEMLVRLRG